MSKLLLLHLTLSLPATTNISNVISADDLCKQLNLDPDQDRQTVSPSHSVPERIKVNSE